MCASTLLSRPFDTGEWLKALTYGPGIQENHPHFWGPNPECLLSSSTAHSLSTGSGLSIFESTLLPAIEAAEHEVILVTCFWARGDTLSRLSASLVRLSLKAIARHDGSKIRVRICFSSRSLIQKLLHTSSTQGHVYAPTDWMPKLGLPHPSQLNRLDLEVKSLFFRPFSVMHPKFLIIDRKLAFMPSCNVSWESWLECSVSLTGPVVDTLFEFWQETWEAGQDSRPLEPFTDVDPARNFQTLEAHVSFENRTAISLSSAALPTILLPSPQHNKPSISLPFPFLASPPPQPTPLNTFLLHLFTHATHTISLITPNLTSPPLLSALLSALTRGIDVQVITNRRMMLLEQLFTAGTVTEIAIWRLLRSYKRLQHTHDPETGRVGRLRIGYFQAESWDGPAKCHIKCTIVDGRVIILGSGNMDRASWYTSQELGIALVEEEVAEKVWERFNKGLRGRVEEVCGY